MARKRLPGNPAKVVATTNLGRPVRNIKTHAGVVIPDIKKAGQRGFATKQSEMPPQAKPARKARDITSKHTDRVFRTLLKK